MAAGRQSQSSAADPALIRRRNADAVLGVTSYNRRDFELPITSMHPSQHDAVRSSIFQAFGQANTVDLGSFGRLPVEIVALICLSLDVTSALRFSHVNRSARELLASIQEFRQLGAHALECLCVLLRTELAARTDISTLHSALTTQNCSQCGSFGGFFFMPTATRCCLSCIASAPEMQVSDLSRVADATGVPAGELEERLPVLHTLRDSRRCVVAVQQALSALHEGGVQDAEAAVSRWPDLLTLRFQASTSLPFVDCETGKAENGVSCKGCQLAFESDFSDDHLELRDRFYSRAGFTQHFEECAAAEKLWISSREGAARVEEPLWMGMGRIFTAPCVGQRRRGSRSEH